MKNFTKKLVFLLITSVLVLQPILDIQYTKASEETTEEEEGAGENVEIFNDEEETNILEAEISDPVAAAANNLIRISVDNSATLDHDYSENSISRVGVSSDSTPKLIFNPSDEQDIRTLYCLGSAIPDFANDIEALALELNRDYGEILRIKMEAPDTFDALVEQAQYSAKGKITSNLRNDVANFACIAGVDETRASEMLANEPNSVEEIIRYASEDIVIDRRIFQLLVNLVTPKNHGGAGHERIKVHRIRSGYNREARQYSRESDAIREQIADQGGRESEGIQTVEDVAGADGSELTTDPTFEQATAIASTEGDTTQNEGDLIFVDTEDDINISAHARGQAIDISEVDNIKCTLIKRRRIGNSTKIKQPPTPIKLLWQTNEGYGQDEQAINDGINSQLRNMMSAEMIDLLDEFGISIDDGSDFSNPNLSDLLQMIGSSLISEVLNSPSNSLGGFDFADTIRRIGAILLADHLDLPRAAFWNTDYSNIDELKASIGEAVFERNLDLPYWSVQGENLSEVLTNVGIRKVESELNLPAGSLNENLTTETDIRLSIGRRSIESNLHLEQGIFQSDTTYRRLREVAGERKIDLIFTNPSTVDERLDLEVGTSGNYVQNGISPDEYANLVGAKMLADNAFIHQYMIANTNAINGTTVSTDINRNQNTQLISDILTGNNGTENYLTNYQQIGIHTIAKAINNNAEIQEATINWLSHNINDSNCAIESEIFGSIVRDGTSVRITIPEDEFIATAQVRRGDLSRLFGCENVAVESVFRRTGEKALIDAIVNSDLATQARNEFLADHPEIQELIADIEFYRTRIDNIKNLSSEIKSEAESLPTDLSGRDEFVTTINRIFNRANAVDTGNLDIGVIREFIRETGSESDIVYQSANRMIQNANEEVIQRLNRIIADIYEIIHNVDEIFAGEPQPRVRSLTIEQIETINSGNSPNIGIGAQSSSINIGVLSMVLAGRIDPEQLLYSVGSGQVEETLDLPANSIYYFVEHIRRDDRDRNQDKNVFFQSIGQAMIEETLTMPSFFFQGENPGDDASLIEIRNHIAQSYSISESEAGARLMRAFGLSGNFNSPSGSANFNNRTTEIDRKLGVSPGTTRDFFLDQLFNTPGAISNTDYQMAAAILGISESSLKRFTAIKNGRETLENANSADALPNIYYSSHNPYSPRQEATGGVCPITYSLRDGISVADGVINDNSYNYVDRTGQHSFPSLEQARNYATINEADRINFLDEIAIALSSRMREAGSTITKEEVEQRLGDFLRNSSAESPFSNEEFVQINYGNVDSPEADPEYLPSDITRNIFARNINHNTASDYKQAVGEATAQRRIVQTIFSGLSINAVGLRIDAGDIFDILSGNGIEVLYRIGGRYLERQLGIPAETISAIIEADTEDLRSCSIQQIGGHMLGSLIGLPYLSLEGNIYNNIGSAAIEQTLGLPAYSFRGANLEELIQNVGAVNFAAAFNLPFTRHLSAHTIDTVLSNSGGSRIEFEKMALAEQISKVRQAIEHPEAVSASSTELSSAISDVKDKIGDEVKRLAEEEASWNYSNNPHTISELDRNRIINAVNSIDSRLGVSPGTTRRFLTEEITPDQFRQRVSETQLLVLAGAEIAQLFVDDMDDDEAREMSESIVNGIRSRNSVDWQNVVVIAAGFFGRAFDARLGIEPGTINRIIADPSQTTAVMMEIGLMHLDRSLGIDPESDMSFSWLYRVYDDYASGDSSEYQNCQLDTEFCFSRPEEPGSVSRVTFRGFTEYIQHNWLAITTHMTSDMIGRYTEDQKIPIDSSDYDLVARDLIGFIQGDMSFIEIAGAVAAASSVNSMGEDAGDLPTIYRVTYADIHYAIRGDARYQARYAARAERSMVSAVVAGDSYGPRPPDLGILALIPGLENPRGTTPPATPSQPGDYSGYEYDTQAHQDGRMSEFEVENPVAPEIVVDDDTYERNRDEVFGDPESREIIRDSRERAAARQRNEALQNLSYRLADGQLWRLDPAIPPGFTETMMTGTGQQRTEMLYEYIRNGFARGEIAGIDLPDWSQGMDFIGVVDFINNPSAENLGNLASSGSLRRIETLLSEEFSDFLGFDLQPGTISALFAGAVTGDFVNNHTFGGVEIPSITQIYSDWATQRLTAFADDFLNLPPGTSYQVLTMYRRVNSLQAALLQPGADLAQIRSEIVSLRAEIISFVITTVFAEQIADAEQAIGLVPGTGGILVGMAVSYLLGAAINPAVIAIFVLQNLFGVFKQELVCTADGYYPLTDERPDYVALDVGDLGNFDGMSEGEVKENYIKAAQYKARSLAGDALMLSERIGDELAIPSQIMVGRQEDVDYWAYKTDEVICSKVGGCAGTRAGMWKNPQTTFYTHIGF